MTMITPSYLGETIEYSSLHACRSTLEDPTLHPSVVHNVGIRPGLAIQHREPPRLLSIEHPDIRPYSRENRRRAYENVLRVWGNPNLQNRFNYLKREYDSRWGKDIHNRGEQYRLYGNNPHYHDYYNQWWDKGFYGGYYYPVHPCNDVSKFFSYPMVYWFYGQSDDSGYYSDYYDPQDYAQYPVEPFQYADDYYPTDELQQMAIDVSGMPADQQANFRSDMTSLTATLEQLISDRLGLSYTLSDNQVVVTYYENLQNQAIVFEGFVDQAADDSSQELHLPFKALLDLNDSSQTALFVPNSADPSNDDLETLNWINDRITQLGGDPLAGHVAEPPTDPNAVTTDPNAGTTTDPNAGTATDPNAGTTTDPNAGTTTDPNAVPPTNPTVPPVTNPPTGTDPNAGTTADPNAASPTNPIVTPLTNPPTGTDPNAPIASPVTDPNAGTIPVNPGATPVNDYNPSAGAPTPAFPNGSGVQPPPNGGFETPPLNPPAPRNTTPVSRPLPQTRPVQQQSPVTKPVVVPSPKPQGNSSWPDTEAPVVDESKFVRDTTRLPSTADEPIQVNKDN